LIYPQLLLVYVPAFLLILQWPLAGPYAFPNYGEQALQVLGLPANTSTKLLKFVLAIFSTGVWWAILGTVLMICPELLQFLARPFADKFSRKWAKVFLLVAILVTILSAGAVVLIVGKYII